MKHLQQDIKQFMLASNQECPEKPTLATPEIRTLRAKLILEEAIEQCVALGFSPFMSGEGFKSLVDHDTVITLIANRDANLIEIADGIADQVYVSVGTAIALGIDMQPIWDLVQRANMDKFGPGSWKRDDGKQMKPPGWVSPNEAIAKEIERQSSVN